MKKNKGWVSEEQQIQNLYDQEAAMVETITAHLEGRAPDLPRPVYERHVPVQTWNQICVKCRVSGNSLPCSLEHHEYIIQHAQNLRVPPKNRPKAWKKFITFLRNRGFVK